MHARAGLKALTAALAFATLALASGRAEEDEFGSVEASLEPELGVSKLADSVEESREMLAAFSELDGVTILDSGVMYRVIESATDPNAKSAESSSLCKLNYDVRLPNGKVIDSSFERGQPLMFVPENVMKGWGEILALMLEGDHWEVAVPAELAYGSAGLKDKIPPNTALTFALQLIAVDPELEGWELVKRTLHKPIPGLPFNFQIWQGAMLIFYVGLRVWLKRRFGSSFNAGPADGSASATAAPAAEPASTKKNK